jgi:hypothetical protein
MSYEVVILPVEDILTRYAFLREQIEKALAHSSGEWNSLQVIQQCISHPDTFHIWEIVEDGESAVIAITRMIEYPNFNSLHIMIYSGKTIKDMVKWSRTFEGILSKFPNIDMIEMTGRRGWVKKLEKLGYTERYTTMRKSLKETINV